MHLSFNTRFSICFILLFIGVKPVSAQLGYDLEIKKPEPYENRVLRAEKSGKKKFTKPKHFFQNTYTHYNYFFNANNRINEIIGRAKEAHKDDFATILPFYNYSLDITMQDKSMLDSVIYKSKSAIVMHDLRNDWIDDMYLLWGASYYLQKSFDSAYQMFQFINYAFAEKEKDGYYRYIGSRMDGNSALSIATKEDEGFLKRMLSDPPSRNTAFIWQVRTLIEANAMTEAGSLILSLKKDPAFPERLYKSLEEVHAYWFYKQNLWDSAATHLINALDNASNKQEKARWEYLAAQLFDLAKKPEQSKEYFSKAISHTIDPVLEIHARLNLIRFNKSSDENYIDENIAELMKMAKREKYIDYRDVIYFMAAQMEMERNNFAAAEVYLLKGAKYANGNNSFKNRSFLQLGDLAFAGKKYMAAASYYDSIQVPDLLPQDAERITNRKGALGKIVGSLTKINRQDSLQRIASMAENERTDYLKKLVRQLRRQQGLKEEEASVSTGSRSGSIGNAFNAETKGDWYFYNPTLKKQGIGVFKQEWGNRPNVDNWRRASDVTAQLRTNVPDNTRGNPATATDAATSVISFDGLMDNLPLTPEKIKVSNEVILSSLVLLGNAYVNDFEDYASAIETYEVIRSRFPDYFGMSEVLFNLYYSYTKIGDAAKAAQVKSLLEKNYPTSRQNSIVSTGIDPSTNKPAPQVTKTYEGIYDLFIEGKFDEALAAKKNADSLYKTNFWSPQLLYIEAVYYVKQREDSIAKNTLNTIIQQHPNTALADKAGNMIQVLSRRKQIEDELQNLNVVRPAADTMVYVPPFIEQPTAVRRDTAIVKTNAFVINQPAFKPRTDTMVTKPLVNKPSGSLYTYDANATQYVVVILNKVDNVFGNEARNAFNRYNKEKYYNLPLTSQVMPLDGENRLLLIGNFTNIMQAAEYVQKAVPLASREIVPWLKADKYSFTLISEKNLEVLKTNPDLTTYKKFLEQQSGLKF